MPWIVTLIKKPNRYTFKDDYFPRKFAYKRDAVQLQKEIEEKGGEATVEKVKN